MEICLVSIAIHKKNFGCARGRQPINFALQKIKICWFSVNFDFLEREIYRLAPAHPKFFLWTTMLTNKIFINFFWVTDKRHNPQIFGGLIFLRARTKKNFFFKKLLLNPFLKIWIDRMTGNDQMKKKGRALIWVLRYLLFFYSRLIYCCVK